jgi:hypothetical protein
LKMVDVHFLRGGGSGKVCFLHTLENGWQLWMTPYKGCNKYITWFTVNFIGFQNVFL